MDFGEFEVSLFKQHVRELVKRQVNRQRTPQRTLLRDKVAFVMGSLGAMCACKLAKLITRPKLAGVQVEYVNVCTSHTACLGSAVGDSCRLVGLTQGTVARLLCNPAVLWQPERVLAWGFARNVLPAVHRCCRGALPAALAHIPDQRVRAGPTLFIEIVTRESFAEWMWTGLQGALLPLGPLLRLQPLDAGKFAHLCCHLLSYLAPGQAMK